MTELINKTETQVHQDSGQNRLQGHWLLAKMGKKVLRPGGIELTKKLLAGARVSHTDRILEFGPGVGRTAQILLNYNPTEYIGIDPNPQGSKQVQAILANHNQAQLIVATAQDTGLENSCVDLVVGEAMLTMHSEEEKLKIISEAFRVLSPGGRYAIHELAFGPMDVPESAKQDVIRALSRTIKVGARPLTLTQWQGLLTKVGFKVEFTATNPMRLLEPSRIIADEGWIGAFKFFRNIRRNPVGRARILAMRQVFRANRNNLQAVAIVAYKPQIRTSS